MITRARVAGALLGVTLAAALIAAASGQAADAARGRHIFAAKQCNRCHLPEGEKGAGPPLRSLKRPQGAYELAGRLWNHAPAMSTLFTQEGVAWPAISPVEMDDLMTYLEADASRDAKPEPERGVTVLVSKGCLKCHRLRGEGGRDAADFATIASSLRPASAWAARLWTHSPRMASVAIAKGVMYPRFSGDQMAQLVAYLTSATAAR